VRQRLPKPLQSLSTNARFTSGFERRPTLKARLRWRLATTAAAKPDALIQQVCAGDSQNATSQRAGRLCAAAWHFMLTRTVTMDAAGLLR
jgi:hypothetical protein